LPLLKFQPSYNLEMWRRAA